MAPHILLINPNSSLATSEMMLAIALTAAGGRLDVKAVTADRSPPMITTPEQLTASAAQVVELGTAHERDCAGIIVSAFGDPGLAELRPGHLYAGVRCTAGDPLALAADAGLLAAALAGAVRDCIDLDGAEAVIVGGGPLGQAAEQLRARFGKPVLGPIPCAVERVFALIERGRGMPQAI